MPIYILLHVMWKNRYVMWKKGMDFIDICRMTFLHDIQIFSAWEKSIVPFHMNVENVE